jgi:hypothetical protein
MAVLPLEAHMASKKPKQTSYKFDKSVDTGPMNYAGMDPSLAQTLHEERIRRQIQSRVKMDQGKKRY